MTASGLTMWTVYESPRDYPGLFVARRWIVDGSEPVATNEVFIATTLAGIHRALPGGLFRLERAPMDDPCIVETWV